MYLQQPLRRSQWGRSFPAPAPMKALCVPRRGFSSTGNVLSPLLRTQVERSQLLNGEKAKQRERGAMAPSGRVCLGGN